MRADAERVRAVRQAIGPDIDLLLDANNRWPAYDAIPFGRMVEKYEPYWFEEPVVADDFLVEEQARFVQWMQQALDQMNVQAHRAISDLRGQTGMAIVVRQANWLRTGGESPLW